MGNPQKWKKRQIMQQEQDPDEKQNDDKPRGLGQPYGTQQPPMGGGGSFLGTAAAAAAGVVGGSLLLGSIRSMMGGGHQQSFGDTAGHSGGIEDRRPDRSDSDLARDAGINDIGSSGGRGGGDNYGSRQGMFDQASNEDNADNDIDHDSDGFDDDGGDSDGGDSDYA